MLELDDDELLELELELDELLEFEELLELEPPLPVSVPGVGMLLSSACETTAFGPSLGDVDSLLSLIVNGIGV